ncbi:expressed unknown protein [Seminavis robusta]|uniref:Uncharacterized protein n=1 Tax=Seminavis robusta TaxID=568900 RepID=A0A9N8H3S7_9STRA|nr:expressed unknown protein [Seminavis robusta]|eukprot:Sro68_g037980.1 n/a (726) ;mRNA; f:32541-34718
MASTLKTDAATSRRELGDKDVSVTGGLQNARDFFQILASKKVCGRYPQLIYFNYFAYHDTLFSVLEAFPALASQTFESGEEEEMGLATSRYPLFIMAEAQAPLIQIKEVHQMYPIALNHGKADVFGLVLPEILRVIPTLRLDALDYLLRQCPELMEVQYSSHMSVLRELAFRFVKRSDEPSPDDNEITLFNRLIRYLVTAEAADCDADLLNLFVSSPVKDENMDLLVQTIAPQTTSLTISHQVGGHTGAIATPLTPHGVKWMSKLFPHVSVLSINPVEGFTCPEVYIAILRSIGDLKGNNLRTLHLDIPCKLLNCCRLTQQLLFHLVSTCRVDELRLHANATCWYDLQGPPDSGGDKIMCDIVAEALELRQAPIPTLVLGCLRIGNLSGGPIHSIMSSSHGAQQLSLIHGSPFSVGWIESLPASSTPSATACLERLYLEFVRKSPEMFHTMFQQICCIGGLKQLEIAPRIVFSSCRGRPEDLSIDVTEDVVNLLLHAKVLTRLKLGKSIHVVMSKICAVLHDNQHMQSLELYASENPDRPRTTKKLAPVGKKTCDQESREKIGPFGPLADLMENHNTALLDCSSIRSLHRLNPDPILTKNKMKIVYRTQLNKFGLGKARNSGTTKETLVSLLGGIVGSETVRTSFGRLISPQEVRLGDSRDEMLANRRMLGGRPNSLNSLLRQMNGASSRLGGSHPHISATHVELPSVAYSYAFLRETPSLWAPG